MSTNTFDIEKFIGEPSNILEELYGGGEIEVKTYEDFLKLPVNEKYKENQQKKLSQDSIDNERKTKNDSEIGKSSTTEP